MRDNRPGMARLLLALLLTTSPPVLPRLAACTSPVSLRCLHRRAGPSHTPYHHRPSRGVISSVGGASRAVLMAAASAVATVPAVTADNTTASSWVYYQAVVDQVNARARGARRNETAAAAGGSGSNVTTSPPPVTSAEFQPTLSPASLIREGTGQNTSEIIVADGNMSTSSGQAGVNIGDSGMSAADMDAPDDGNMNVTFHTPSPTVLTDARPADGDAARDIACPDSYPSAMQDQMTLKLKPWTVIYDDDLAPEWSDWSWKADVNTQSSKTNRGRFALRAETDLYGALSLFTARPFNGGIIDFWLYTDFPYLKIQLESFSRYNKAIVEAACHREQLNRDWSQIKSASSAEVLELLSLASKAYEECTRNTLYIASQEVQLVDYMEDEIFKAYVNNDATPVSEKSKLPLMSWVHVRVPVHVLESKIHLIRHMDNPTVMAANSSIPAKSHIHVFNNTENMAMHTISWDRITIGRCLSDMTGEGCKPAEVGVDDPQISSALIDGALVALDLIFTVLKQLTVPTEGVPAAGLDDIAEPDVARESPSTIFQTIVDAASSSMETAVDAEAVSYDAANRNVLGVDDVKLYYACMMSE